MPDQIDDGAEAAVTRLTAAIEAIEPHVSALHMRIILQGDAGAHECLSALVRAAEQMTDDVCQQDFMNLDTYRAMHLGETA